MLKVEEHEKHINDLTQFLKLEGIDQAKVSTILQGLRDNYTEVTTSITDTTKKVTEINTLNEGLRSANMMLLSKLGTPTTETKKQEETKTTETAKSLDDIALEFLK
jgi:regulator of replication initiation timing